MVQGTMSNSGKSFLTAGLCRVFKQDGYKVAPFKSQNMALNSYITKEGLEIGRAQAMQAEACGIDPTANMNPILLKPTSNVGSQVIVNGEVRGNMKAMDYYKNKKQLFNILKGDMSLVGPRPERPFFVEKFREEIPRYMIKHQVRPGLTGWAQVNGFRGDTSIKKRIEYDLYYIENWTMGLDFKILFLTFFKGFVNKNAY